MLKVENGVPNPDDALRIFCEVVGVTPFRESESIPQVDENHPLYLDFPGFGLSEMDEWTGANKILDDLGVGTRILVVNGAYDREIINRYIRSSKSVNATHIAITHFDEMTNSQKLWPIILNSNLAPVLYLCNGQNVTGDFSTSVLNQLIAKTFPRNFTRRVLPAINEYSRHMKNDARFFFCLTGFVSFILFYLIASLLHQNFCFFLDARCYWLLIFAIYGRFLLSILLKNSIVQSAQPTSF